MNHYLPTWIHFEPITQADHARIAKLDADRRQALNWMQSNGIKPLVSPVREPKQLTFNPNGNPF